MHALHSFIPTPTFSTVALGPFTIHMYALCILLGAIAALSIGRARYAHVGGDPKTLTDLAIWVIPAGIIGGRLYHVATSPDAYFGTGGSPRDALKIWKGGMGIWGAVALGTLVAFLLFRRKDQRTNFALFADALAPGLLVAQAIGRWGNWFNGELFGRPLHSWWGLEIPRGLRPVGFEGYSTFHPTFLYESLWCLFVAGAIILAERRTTLRAGSTFLIYIFLYCLGRVAWESLRIDPAHTLFGLRVNLLLSLVLMLTSGLWLWRRNRGSSKMHP